MSAWHPPWPGFSARGSLLLPLPADAFGQLEPELRVGGLVLERKSEFHLTVLDRALGARVQGRREAAPTLLVAAWEALDWAWSRRGDRWLLREDRDGASAHSVIELLELPALAAFRRAIAELLGEQLPPGLAHCTLYVAGRAAGISLASVAEFERLRQRPL